MGSAKASLSFGGALLVLAFSMALALVPAGASACSCVAHDHASAVRTFDVAFRARVVSMTMTGNDEHDVVFEIVRAWKGGGQRGTEVVVHVESTMQMCPVPGFAVGRLYDVYASRIEERLIVGGCNPSRPVRRERP
jgi:hypothetical protein